ncbi:NUDIX domain-containing protein [Candidatus Woesearchaeota archaeon]|nr:NUDIX domain-containing protein [Candidatus Woesearchaeota archaeon]
MGIGEIKVIDIVDKNDKIIGQIKDSKMHGGNFITRGVGVFVINNKKEIYLQKRSEHKYRYPLHWDFSAGGIVDSGKTYKESIIDELKEEIGIHVKEDEVLLLEKTFVDNDIKEFQSRFKIYFNGEINKHNWEVKEGTWKK